MASRAERVRRCRLWNTNHAERITNCTIASLTPICSVHSNPTADAPISQFIPTNAQIFLENVPGKSFGQKLAVEVGHLFRFFVNGNPMTGIKTYGENGAGNVVDTADVTETAIVHEANDAMRTGAVRYLDDYTTVSPSSMVTPGRTANILGDLAPRKTVSYSPTAFDIYRLGARRVAAQQR